LKKNPHYSFQSKESIRYPLSLPLIWDTDRTMDQPDPKTTMFLTLKSWTIDLKPLEMIIEESRAQTGRKTKNRWNVCVVMLNSWAPVPILIRFPFPASELVDFVLLKHSFKEFVWYCFNDLFSFTVSVNLLLLSGLYKLCCVMLCYWVSISDYDGFASIFSKSFNNFNCGYLIREICGGARLWLWQTRRFFVTILWIDVKCLAVDFTHRIFSNLCLWIILFYFENL